MRNKFGIGSNVFCRRIEASKDRRVKIFTLFDSGHSNKQISRQLNVSPSCVSQTLNGRKPKTKEVF